ncbi:SDR family NAD(P)-dependent oxidoreductase [Streptomyces bohaiensis]|uniref:SDR family oxidoreductase n=1 Tax=Streptomyces bohaiensis TaxID=1431344 RepID=A0ABX1CCD0_9ACTN|nr:SDR family oxidoreductase [Streptomyces bohaiensis]NJQ16761.1 SDR family oxidoreductase [Streptomyces bohaiensis]
MARTVLITGGSSGIGLAAAKRFASDGDRVVITGRHADRVRAAADESGAEGVVCDGTDPAQVARLAESVGDELDVLVNSAGGLPEFTASAHSRLETTLAEWNAALSKNLLTAVLTTTAVRDRLLASGSGTVISLGAIGADHGAGSYGAAKAALAAWNVVLSSLLGPKGVTSNVIAAGFVDDTNLFHGRMTDSRREGLVAETHDKRPGAVDDIAATIHFLASPGARHITGQTIHVNGGAHTTR